MSLLKALEYLEKIGGYQTLEDIEKKLMSRALERFRGYGDQIELIGSDKLENRLGIFSFVLKNQKNIQMVGELFAEK